jgi:hypothetical protein
MPIHAVAHYSAKPSGVDKVKQAIAEFVPHIRANEPGPRIYLAWHQKDDPTCFVHFFILKMKRRIKPTATPRRSRNSKRPMVRSLSKTTSSSPTMK